MNTEAQRYMQAALSLARRGLGQTWPNPAVGAVLVKDGQIIASAHTARGGRPHAETQATQQAGAAAKGATLYVTLEPCAHQGQTPPCTQAIIKAGIVRCVVACRDPHAKVNGQGIAQLRNAGIDVIEGVCTKEAQELNRGFFSSVEKKRPLVSLKIATSLDGKIATASKDSKWITSEAARNYGHLLRSRYDAVVTGIGTVLADDPAFTCRLPGLEKNSPVRVVLDSDLRIPAECQLVKTAKKTPTWVLTKSRKKAPGDTVTWLCTEGAGPQIDLPQALQILAEQGITRLLVEAGSRLSTAFLQSGLVDRVYWFRAPLVIGGDGLDMAAGGFSQTLSQLARWKQTRHTVISSDTLDEFECLPA